VERGAGGRVVLGVTYRLAIFDMDGTLADSLPWFARNLNAVADKFRFRRIAADEIESLRHLDTRHLLARFEIPLWKVPLIARHMRALKARHIDEIPLFPGVDPMLRDLKATGIAIAVVTSDNEANTRRTLGAENAAHIEHYACGAALFGKAAKFRQVLRLSGVAAKDALAIGDETRDAEAARQVGIAFGAVAWGYANIEALRALRPKHVFFSVDEIVQALA
jgi:phosphoglycolate phosphatase